MLEIADTISNIIIAISGVLSVFMVASQRAKIRMWGGIIGLIGEPFWFYTAYINNQLGIIVLAFVYSVAWILVIRNNRVAAR